MTDAQLFTQISSLPSDLKKEVADFVALLKQKKSISSKRKTSPKFGSLKGKIHLSADFDDPLDDFKDYM